MDLTKIVLSSANTFKEVDFLREELGRLPQNYQPFNLESKQKVGAMLFAGAILLSPMVGKDNVYRGNIRHPDGSVKGESLYEGEDEEIIIGAQFIYQDRKFVLYRTEYKHENS